MLEKWKNAVDKGKYFGGSISDLSETLFLTNCYSKITSLSFRFIGTKTYSRLPFKQKIRTKINSRYSSWEEILFGVLQGYIFGTFLFNIFLCDQYWLMGETDFAGYADDNTLYVSRGSVGDVVKQLEDGSIIFKNRFQTTKLKQIVINVTLSPTNEVV